MSPWLKFSFNLLRNPNNLGKETWQVCRCHAELVRNIWVNMGIVKSWVSWSSGSHGNDDCQEKLPLPAFMHSGRYRLNQRGGEGAQISHILPDRNSIVSYKLIPAMFPKVTRLNLKLMPWYNCPVRSFWRAIRWLDLSYNVNIIVALYSFSLYIVSGII